jgi:hypothetical protein
MATKKTGATGKSAPPAAGDTAKPAFGSPEWDAKYGAAPKKKGSKGK